MFLMLVKYLEKLLRLWLECFMKVELIIIILSDLVYGT
jgi:hypothetical protein